MVWYSNNYNYQATIGQHINIRDTFLKGSKIHPRNPQIPYLITRDTHDYAVSFSHLSHANQGFIEISTTDEAFLREEMARAKKIIIQELITPQPESKLEAAATNPHFEAPRVGRGGLR